MVIKVNFGLSGTPSPEGFILDYGQGYSDDLGIGWIEQDSDSSPLDVTNNGRERNTGLNQLRDSLIHLQYPSNNGVEVAETTPAAWEYALENGDYRVTVSVGDFSYVDSIHAINVEGDTLISGFTPRRRQLFTTRTQVVTVEDGKLTIDAEGGVNTKINSIQIASITEARINFAPQGAKVNDYFQDFGKAYDETRGYGWITEESIGSETVPLDITPNSRERNTLDNRLQDTFLHLQFPTDVDNSGENVLTPAAWEYAIENGEYIVSVSVGDSDFTDSEHVVNIEGKPIVSGFTPTEDEQFVVGNAIVEVTDGKLTLDAIGGTNTKINYIDIKPLAPIKVNFGLHGTEAPSGYIQDFGEGYTKKKGFGWITEESIGEERPTSLDVTINARDRNRINDQLLDTMIHMQYTTEVDNPRAETTPAAWEYDLLNGSYKVTVGVGDSPYFDSTHVINAEGVELISPYTPTISDQFRTGEAIIDVTDGKLTIDAIGGSNTKINFIEIETLSLDSI